MCDKFDSYLPLRIKSHILYFRTT